MNRFIRVLFIVLFVQAISIVSFAQFDTASVARRARHVNIGEAKNVEKLSAVLSKGCKSDDEIVYAFAYWICKNIRLDYSAYEKRPAENKSLKKILRSKKALCDGYTKLFVELCHSKRIPAVYVPAYVKDYDFISGDTLFRAEYAYALVAVSGEWQIMDLTAASSKVVSVANPMSRVLWKMFRIPYSTHLKAVKEFNPQYLYIDPFVNLKRIVPVVDMFQMLEYPMPLTYFMLGDSMVNSYVDRYHIKKSHTEDIEHFWQMSLNDKNVYLGDESERLNMYNQYTKALYYYFTVKNFYNTYYIKEKGKIFAPLEESQKALKLLKQADSLFVLSAKNNEHEFLSKQRRSDSWRVNLLESNKVLSSRLSLQSKVNSQQLRTINKVNSQTKKTQAFIAKYKNKYVLRDISELGRPQMQNRDYLVDGQAKLDASKEAMKRCENLLHDFDSLMADMNKKETENVYTQQKNASKLCNDELASLSRYLDRKESNLSLVYYSDKYVLKKGYLLIFEKVGNINEGYTDPMLELMLERSPQINTVIKNYVDETVTALKLLKEAKVLLANDYGEDDTYEKIALAFNKQLDAFVKRLNEMSAFTDKISTCLKDDVTMYNDIVSLLQHDNSMENRRHKEYMEYRKSIKQAENDKIRYYQETMKGYQKVITRAVNGK
ncbi:MAG: transglutaminase-like domain-containing protein [Bacteroidales bacterium]|nr:transglutaminase-like domain-containing protein [Bacteroidales bacterium]